LDGYLARLPPNRGNQRSVEHNIDIYALAGAPLKKRHQTWEKPSFSIFHSRPCLMTPQGMESIFFWKALESIIPAMENQ